MTQWEYELVEKPFCQQLAAMGWQWIEGDPGLPESTEQTSSREVLLRGRPERALPNCQTMRVELEHDGHTYVAFGAVAAAAGGPDRPPARARLARSGPVTRAREAAGS